MDSRETIVDDIFICRIMSILNNHIFDFLTI